MFTTKDEIEAELRRVADGVRDGSVRVSDLPFFLTTVIQSAQELGREAARLREIPSAHARGVGVVFPIEIETPSESAEEDDVDAFTREEAEALFQAAMRGDVLTKCHERALDVYAPEWRAQRRQFGRSPSHPLWGKTIAPNVGTRRSALLTRPTLAILERYTASLASLDARFELTTIAVAICSLTRAAPWAEEHRNRMRASGEEGVVLVSTHENRPLGLADALMTLAERERPGDADLDEALSDDTYRHGIAAQNEIVNALLTLAEAVKKLYAITHHEPEKAS